MNTLKNYYSYLFMTIILLVLSGCAEMGQLAGQVASEALSSAVTTGSDRALGKHKGKVSSIRVLREDETGYLLEVRYRDVQYPQGVSMNAEAYGVQGLLTEYQSAPYPISTKSGRVQLQLAFQDSGWFQTKPVPTLIVVKLFRDEDPANHLAASTLDLGTKVTSDTTASSSTTGSAQPDVIVPEATAPSSSSTSTTGTVGTVAIPRKTVTSTSTATMIPVQTMALATTLPYTTGTSKSCTSGANNSFLTTDSVAYLRVTLNNIKAGDYFRYEWYDPTGARYRTKKYSKQPAGTKVCHSDRIYIKGKTAANKPGTWSVKFYYRNQLKVTKKFTISKPAYKAPPKINIFR